MDFSAPAAPAPTAPAAPAHPGAPAAPAAPAAHSNPSAAARNEPTTSVPPTNEPGTGAAAPSIPPDLQNLGQALGVDFNSFSSEADARNAARLIVERYAATGMANRSGLTQEPPAPAPAPAPARPSVTIEDDDEETYPGWATADPKTRKELKRLEQEIQTARSEAEQLRQQFHQQQEAVVSRQRSELVNRANAALDAVGSPKYGVGADQNFGQRVARQNVLQLAESIVAGLQSSGQRIPVIEDVIRMATYYADGGQPAQPTQPAAPNPADVLSSLTNGGGNGQYAPPPPGAGPRVNTKSEVDDFKNDPNYRAGVRAILGR